MLENAIKDIIKKIGEMMMFCTLGVAKITVNSNKVVIKDDRMNHAFQVDCFIVIKFYFLLGLQHCVCSPATRGVPCSLAGWRGLVLGRQQHPTTSIILPPGRGGCNSCG